MAVVNEGALKKMLKQYKYRDLTVREITNVISQYKDLKPVMDAYVFNDGSTRDLMSLTGTVPVSYRGNVYNIPVCLWLLDTYPYNPPICFVKPTSAMMIKTGKHIDANGKIYLPYLHEWKHPQSDLYGLIQVMIVVFGEEPPVFSRPTTQAPYQAFQAAGPPNPSYMPGMPAVSPYGFFPVVISYFFCSSSGPSRDGTIGEDTIRASLISAVSDKLRWRMKEEMDRAQAELDALKRTEEDLKKGHQKLEEMVSRLDQEVTEVDRNIELLKRKDEELSEALEKMENQSENNDIDDVIVPTAPLYKQILNLYAEENAIEDTIFYLGEALRRGVIDLEVFLKVTTLHTRKCVKETFTHMLASAWVFSLLTLILSCYSTYVFCPGSSSSSVLSCRKPGRLPVLVTSTDTLTTWKHSYLHTLLLFSLPPAVLFPFSCFPRYQPAAHF
uniref:UEV domain-containing protein n=1 Tax=Amphiprion ocellaris TaxID=80972 RepID=A0AAQ5XQY4_AMPOC